MATYNAKLIQDPISIQGNLKATVIENQHDVECVQYSELYDYLLAGYADGGIRVFKDMKFVMELMDKDIKANNISVSAMKHRPVSKNYPVTNTLVCTYSNGFVKFWNYNFQECTFTLQENRRTTNVVYHPKLAKFVTMGDNSKIYLYDEDSKRQERVLSASDVSSSTDGHKGTVISACFHPKLNHELISGGTDNTIQYWDTRTPHAVRHIDGVTISGNGLDFSPTGTEFVTCACQKDSPMILWNYGTGQQIKVIEPDKYKSVELSGGCYLNKTHFVCGGGEPNLVRIVDMTSYRTTSMLSNIQKVKHGFTVGPASANPLPKFAFCGGKKIYEISPK